MVCQNALYKESHRNLSIAKIYKISSDNTGASAYIFSCYSSIRTVVRRLKENYRKFVRNDEGYFMPVFSIIFSGGVHATIIDIRYHPTVEELDDMCNEYNEQSEIKPNSDVNVFYDSYVAKVHKYRADNELPKHLRYRRVKIVNRKHCILIPR